MGINEWVGLGYAEEGCVCNLEGLVFVWGSCILHVHFIASIYIELYKGGNDLYLFNRIHINIPHLIYTGNVQKSQQAVMAKW